MILYAEDNPTSQKVMKIMLEKLGYSVTCANDGREAENLYLSCPEKYALAILDYEMPYQTGIQLTKKIRKTNQKMPIFILTAHSTEKDKEECMEFGANEFLTKPLPLKTLSCVLSKYQHQQSP